MASVIADVKQLHKELLREFEKKPAKDIPKIIRLLDDLKVKFVQMPFLPTRDVSSADVAILALQRDVLELSALVAIEKGDISGFERAVAQLKTYYGELADVLDSACGESGRKHHIMGLNLMSLLAQNKLAAFHTELELLPYEIVASDVYISHPVQLEQFLMEGTYNKVFLSKTNIPSEYYKFFMDILLTTVRSEIAKCIEKAYESIGVNEAAKMLFLSGGAAEMMAFASKKGWNHNAARNEFVFENKEMKKKLEDNTLTDQLLALNSLFYAKQLEMIV